MVYLKTVDDERREELNKVSSDVHYNIAMAFDESDAEGTIKALVEKYPGLVIKALSQRFIHNLATLEAMDSFMRNWK